MSGSSDKLAVFGGEPAVNKTVAIPDWPPIDETTAERLREVYLSREWSFHSPCEKRFAQAFATHHDARHGIFMANGTVTLEAALAALGIGPGDEVVVPALTWMSTALAVYDTGAMPVFADVQADTLCLDPAAAEAAITSRTRAVLPVHLFGSMADLEKILALAQRHGLAVVEDCAHMQGGQWAGQGVGSWGDVGSFSFQQSKTMSSGEGGICLTQDDRLADRIFRYKHIGYALDQKQGQAETGPPGDLICHNYRATAFQAAILEGQLAGIEDRLTQYNRFRDIIEKAIEGIPGIRLQSRGRLATLQGYYCLVVLFDQEPLKEVSRAVLGEALWGEGIAFGGTYGPVYQHKLFNLSPQAYRVPKGGCPISEWVGTERALSLPHQWMNADLEVAAQFGQALAKVASQPEALFRLANRVTVNK